MQETILKSLYDIWSVIIDHLPLLKTEVQKLLKI